MTNDVKRTSASGGRGGGQVGTKITDYMHSRRQPDSRGERQSAMCFFMLHVVCKQSVHAACQLQAESMYTAASGHAAGTEAATVCRSNGPSNLRDKSPALMTMGGFSLYLVAGVIALWAFTHLPPTTATVRPPPGTNQGSVTPRGTRLGDGERGAGAGPLPPRDPQWTTAAGNLPQSTTAAQNRGGGAAGSMSAPAQPAASTAASQATSSWGGQATAGTAGGGQQAQPHHPDPQTIGGWGSQTAAAATSGGQQAYYHHSAASSLPPQTYYATTAASTSQPYSAGPLFPAGATAVPTHQGGQQPLPHQAPGSQQQQQGPGGLLHLSSHHQQQAQQAQPLLPAAGDAMEQQPPWQQLPAHPQQGGPNPGQTRTLQGGPLPATATTEMQEYMSGAWGDQIDWGNNDAAATADPWNEHGQPTTAHTGGQPPADTSRPPLTAGELGAMFGFPVYDQAGNLIVPSPALVASTGWGGDLPAHLPPTARGSQPQRPAQPQQQQRPTHTSATPSSSTQGQPASMPKVKLSTTPERPRGYTPPTFGHWAVDQHEGDHDPTAASSSQAPPSKQPPAHPQQQPPQPAAGSDPTGITQEGEGGGGGSSSSHQAPGEPQQPTQHPPQPGGLHLPPGARGLPGMTMREHYQLATEGTVAHSYIERVLTPAAAEEEDEYERHQQQQQQQGGAGPPHQHTGGNYPRRRSPPRTRANQRKHEGGGEQRTRNKRIKYRIKQQASQLDAHRVGGLVAAARSQPYRRGARPSRDATNNSHGHRGEEHLPAQGLQYTREKGEVCGSAQLTRPPKNGAAARLQGAHLPNTAARGGNALLRRGPPQPRATAASPSVGPTNQQRQQP